jgi:hypothetical protein
MPEIGTDRNPFLQFESLDIESAQRLAKSKLLKTSFLIHDGITKWLRQHVPDKLCNNSDMSYRYVASAIVGAVLFLFYFHPFLPYSQRSQLSPNWWPFLVTTLIFGFLLSLGLTRRRFWVPTCLLLTLFAANAILIVVDSITGAVDHNLFPIEFLFIALLTSPTYFGALLGAAVDWFRARGLKT